MKAAWKEIKLRDLHTALAHKTVRVTFMKVNGEKTTREATRNAAFVPREFAPKGHGGSSHDKTVTFYSLTDGGWRLFRSDNPLHFK